MKIRQQQPVYSLLAILAASLLFGSTSSGQATSAAATNSPVDRSSKLEKIDGEFGLADGAAWDGNWSLYIPDVKAQTLFRYIPKTKKLNVVKKNIGRISASFFQHGRLYLSDNGEQSISYFQGGKKVVVHKFGDGGGKPLRPNDLVVDNDGGIYVTFTPQNQVHYIAANGKLAIAVDGIKTPNGITLSPDGKTLYVSSFVPKEIYSYEVSSPGIVSKGKKFATLPESQDRGADGMAIDRAGNVLCTGPTGVTIWSPSGTLLDKIETPSKPINCIYGDQDMRTLYISCFGGVYSQRMLISGRNPQPANDENPSFPNKKNPPPSTIVPDNIKSQLDVTYTSYGDRKMLMDIFIPQTAGVKPAVVVVHGGGWLKGDKSKFRALAIRLARSGLVTAAIEYRLGHESHFPAAIHDCNSAVKFLRVNAKDFGIDPKRIGVVGGSAGGHLAGLMASGWKNKKLQGESFPDRTSKVAAAIVLAGPLQMATGSVAERSRLGKNSNSNAWLGKTIDNDKELYLLADAYEQIDKDTSPILFMTGEFDNPDRNQASREKLKAAGVFTDIKTYENGKHGCWNQNPWFEIMAKDMVDYFKNQLK